MKVALQAVLTLRLENMQALESIFRRTVLQADTWPSELALRLSRACSVQQALPSQQAAAAPPAIARFALPANTPTLVL